MSKMSKLPREYEELQRRYGIRFKPIPNHPCSFLNMCNQVAVNKAGGRKLADDEALALMLWLRKCTDATPDGGIIFIPNLPVVVIKHQQEFYSVMHLHQNA